MKNFLSLYLFIVVISNVFGQCYPDQHSTNWMDAWVSCQKAPSPNPANPDGHWIVYDLKERYDIEQIKFWNINDPAHLDWGIKDFKVEYSGNYINWYDAGTYKLSRGTGLSRYEGMDWISIRIPEVRYILITALNNYGTGDCFGLAEARFSAEKVLISDNDNHTSSSELSATIQPNPVNDQFMAKIQLQAGETIEYLCIDMYGHILETAKVNLSKSNYILRILTANWIPGQYQFVVKSNNQVKRYSVVKI